MIPTAHPRLRPGAAFTLIEMLVAITLGLVIISTVVAGMRVASKAITVVNHLAQENQLMRLGCEVAHDHLDFWTDIDDPDDGANRKLRGSDPGGGLPFTPMHVVAPYSPGDATLGAEGDTGWNPAEAWSEADPRIWWHGDLAEKYNSRLWHGRYSIFTNGSHSLTLGTVPSIPSDYGQVTVRHNWLNNQLWSLSTAMGYYGYFDYMPANTLYQCYMPYLKPEVDVNGKYTSDIATNDDGQPLIFDQYSSGFVSGSEFANGEGAQENPFDLYRLTMGTAIGLVNPAAANATVSALHRTYYYLDYTNTNPLDQQTTFNQFNADTTHRVPLLTSDGPVTWPHVLVSTQRFIKTNRFVNICRVALTDPLTGDHAQLVWDGIGSTLRGARLQRGQSGGWAVWDNDPTTLASNTATLDDP